MACEVNELEDFLLPLNNVFEMSRRSQSNRDPIRMEHCKNKLEHYIPIVVAMKVAVSENTAPNPNNLPCLPPLNTLIDNLVTAMEIELGKCAEVIENCPVEGTKDVVSLLPSTGGRPA